MIKFSANVGFTLITLFSHIYLPKGCKSQTILHKNSGPMTKCSTLLMYSLLFTGNISGSLH